MNLFSVKDLSLSLGGNKILDNISFDIPANKFTVIVGPNGAGKSFLLRSIAGLENDTMESVSLNGHQLSSLTEDQIAKEISWTPEKIALPFNYDAKQICVMGRFPMHKGSPSQEDHKECKSAFEQMGIETLIERKTNELSSGELKKVMVATSLASGCNALLLDEPAANLDVNAKLKLLKLLKKKSEQITIVAVVHDLSLAHKFADFIILLNKGKLHCAAQPEKSLSHQNIKEVFGVDSENISLASGDTQLVIF